MVGRTALCAATLCLLLAGPAARAQQVDPAFRHLSIGDGLSQSIVTASLQDRTGIMWFVTEDGLNRYDGYTFRVFKHDPADPASLAHNEIKSICEGADGSLWVGTFYRGLERFDPATERFEHLRHDPADPGSLSHDIVWAVLEDRKGRLWVGTGGGGLDMREPGSKAFRHFSRHPSDPGDLLDDHIRVLFEDREGRIWAGSEGTGLYRFEEATGTFQQYRHIPKTEDTLSDDDVRALAQGPDGSLWVGTKRCGLNRLDPATGKVSIFRHQPLHPNSLPSDSVLALKVDPSGKLWVGTDGGGLARLDPQTGRFDRFVHDPTRPTSLAGDRVHSLYLDRSQVLWVGTYGSGVSRCDLNRKAFFHYRRDPSDPASLGHDIVWSFWESPPGTLWVGTNDGGLDRLDRATGRFTHFRHDPLDPGSLSSDSVRMVRVDRRGRVWAATNGGGLDRLDPATGRFTHFRHDPSDGGSLAHDELRMVFEDRQGVIWVGTYGGGLDRYDEATGRFVHHRSDPTDPTTISNDYVRVALEDASGALWFGTHGGGLNRFDRASGTFTRFRHDPLDPGSLSNDFVFSLLEDRSGTFWVATYGGGLNRLDRATGRFTALRKSDGLPDDAVYGVLEDGRGDLWVSTNSGLARLEPRTGRVRTYTLTDGLQSNEFNGGSYYQNAAGEMFFGGINGFNVFDPDVIRDDPYQAPVVFTDFQLANQSVPVGPLPDGRVLLSAGIAYTEALQLSYQDRVVSFEFAALDYAAPEKNRYAFRLEGLQGEWAELGTRRFVMFTTLPPGHYDLQVRGTNSDGVWNETGASLRIVVLPPWWRTGWAYTLYALLGAAALAGLLRFERARERQRGRLVEAELRAQAAELQTRTAEAESRALKAENDRKTHELEAARKLQLSMLPAHLPDHPRFRLAARMRTATEVGGDYYDAHLGERGALTLVLGDATGHGTRAGIMVAVMKGLFSRMAPHLDLQAFFRESDRTLRSVGLGQIYMALGIVRIEGGDARAVGAALPPALLQRAGSTAVQEVPLRGMFLGTELELPYEEVRFALGPGDRLLLMSDGLLEQADGEGEMVDSERAAAWFVETAGLEPEAVLDRLFERLDAWRAEVHQSDDVTLLYLEVRPDR